MKKRIAVVLMFLISLTCLLTGCQLVTLDQEKYLNQTVAKVGNEIEISLEDLYLAYQNYSSTLTSDDYGLSNEEALEYSLDYLIQREIIYLKAKETITFTQKEKNEILESTYAYIVSEINNYEEEVRNELGTLSPEDYTSDSSTSETSYVEAKYEPQVNLVDGVIVRNEKKDEAPVVPAYGYSAGLVKGFKAYWNKSEEGVSDTAYKRFIAALKEYEENKDLSKKDDEILEREIKRVYELQEKDFYIKKHQDEYEKSHLATGEEVYAKYVELYEASKARYQIDEIGFDNYVNDMLEDRSNVFYHPEEGKFFYVSHILLQFNDDQTKLIEERKTLLEQGAITQADFDAYKAELAKEISVKRRDENGNEVGGAVLAQDIYDEIATSLAGQTFEEKSRIFNSYIYQFNSDPGILNNEYDYVIGVKNEEDKKGEETRSKMVAEFTEDSRKLYDEYLATGEFGALSSQLVLTDYGYHIIFLTGAAENLIVSQNVLEAMGDLNNYTVSAHTTQTYFHNVYDKAITSKYNDYVLAMIANYKAGKECVTYTKVYNLLKDRLG